MSARKLIIAGTFLLLVFLAVGGVALAIVLAPSRLHPPPSEVETPPLPPLGDGTSSVAVPLSIPLALVEDAIRDAVPERVTGAAGSGLGRRSWDLGFTSLPTVSANGDRLRLHAALDGSAAWAGGSFSTVVEVWSDFAIRFGEGVSLILEPTTTVDLEFGSSLAALFGEDQAVAEVVRMIASEAGALSAEFERRAHEAWGAMCTTLGVGPGEGIELAFEPQRASVTQPVITSESIDLSIGVDARTRLGAGARTGSGADTRTGPDADTRTRSAAGAAGLDCTPLQELSVVANHEGAVDFVFPVEIGYEQLDSVVAERYAGTRLGGSVAAEVLSIAIRPYGESLLLALDVAVTENWFGSRTNGLVYVVVDPVIDVEQQALRVTGTRIHAQSGGALMTLFAKLGGPSLEEFLEAETVALGPILDEWRGEASTAMDAIDVGPLRIEGDIESLGVERMDVGPATVRVVLSARGPVSGSVVVAGR